MKIGDRIFVRGYIDEIRKDTVIVRNGGGYFGTVLSEVTGELPFAQPGWIPLAVKYPETNEDVLLQFPSNQGVGFYENGSWGINTGDGIYSAIGDGEEMPMAWMPLPKPWEGR